MKNWIEINDIDGSILVIDRDDITHMRLDSKIGVISCSIPEGYFEFRVLPEEFGRVKEELMK